MRICYLSAVIDEISKKSHVMQVYLSDDELYLLKSSKFIKLLAFFVLPKVYKIPFMQIIGKYPRSNYRLARPKIRVLGLHTFLEFVITVNMDNYSMNVISATTI